MAWNSNRKAASAKTTGRAFVRGPEKPIDRLVRFVAEDVGVHAFVQRATADQGVITVIRTLTGNLLAGQDIPELCRQACRRHGVDESLLRARLWAVASLFPDDQPLNQDPYEILGVEPWAGPDDIKRAFRTLCLQWHPDHNPDDPQAAAHFRRITAAYDMVRDSPRPSGQTASPRLDVWDETGACPRTITWAGVRRLYPLALVVALLLVAVFFSDILIGRHRPAVRSDASNQTRQATPETAVLDVRPETSDLHLSPPPPLPSTGPALTDADGLDKVQPQAHTRPARIDLEIAPAGSDAAESPHRVAASPIIPPSNLEAESVSPRPTRAPESLVAKIPSTHTTDKATSAPQARPPVPLADKHPARQSEEADNKEKSKAGEKDPPRLARQQKQDSRLDRLVDSGSQPAPQTDAPPPAALKPEIKPDSAAMAATSVDLDVVSLAETEKRLERFLHAYTRDYSRRDLNAFLQHFAANARENGVRLEELRHDYARSFQDIPVMAYQINVGRTLFGGDTVRLTGQFTLTGAYADGRALRSHGALLMELLPHGQTYLVHNLEYTFQQP